MGFSLVRYFLFPLLYGNLVSGFQGTRLLHPRRRFPVRAPRVDQAIQKLGARDICCSPARGAATKLHERTNPSIPLDEESISYEARTYNSTESLNEAIGYLCHHKEIQRALEVLSSAEDHSKTGSPGPDATSYIVVIKGLIDETGPEGLDAFLERMNAFCNVTAVAYNLVISAWARSASEEAPERADQLLTTLWSLYNETKDYTMMPNRATYMGVMTAHSRSGKGEAAAFRTEELLEEMETAGEQHPALKPTTAFVNVVLHAWSRSGSPTAIARCQAILQRMEGLALNGREELAPSTISFNTVIDALARKNKPNDGEKLLARMDELSQQHVSWECKPDSISFNTVLNGWAKCSRPGSAKRAEDILIHMESRYKRKATDVAPDEASYANVIHAWSRSREPHIVQRSYQVLDRMEQAFENGNLNARPGTMVYNTMLNVLSKCIDEQAQERALDLLSEMKTKRIALDVFTYTSAIDVLAKGGSAEWSDKAGEMLDEMMEEQTRTGRSDLKPNVRTFTSAINAVGRSNERPERALAMLERMREAGVQPDSICYNAVINAYGWSQVKGKEETAFSLLLEMLDRDSLVKPDIITANSVLHTCAFAASETESERAKAMEVAIQTLEIFTRDADKYGKPDHITFGNMLLAIAKQMPMSEKRISLAEATFWTCCEAGYVCSLVVQRLKLALPSERLTAILGSAILKNTESSFVFNMKELPAEWQKYAPRAGKRKASRASEKKDERNFTKETNRQR